MQKHFLNLERIPTNMSRKRYYPSTPKAKLENIANNISYISKKNIKQTSFEPLVEFDKQEFKHNDWVNQVMDSWNNKVANIDTNKQNNRPEIQIIA